MARAQASVGPVKMRYAVRIHEGGDGCYRRTGRPDIMPGEVFEVEPAEVSVFLDNFPGHFEVVTK